MNDLSQGCFSLAKTNNGFFKSEAQAKFLTLKIEERDGCIGHVTSGYHSCPIFVTLDEKGITKIVKSTKSNGDVVMFERVVEGVVNSLQQKDIDHLTKLAKKLQKELNEKVKSFNDGSYNGTGDISTYSTDMIERYNSRVLDYQNRILLIKQKLGNKNKL